MPIDEQKNNRSDACTALGEQLSAYLDGELSEEETEAVEAHLLVCDDCAALCRALRALRVEIAGAQLDPPPELHEKIMLRIRHDSRMRKLRRIVAAASAGVAAMFCFVIIGGAMRTEKMDMTLDNAPEAAIGLALNENAARCMDDMTGGVLDMLLEADITLVGTGLSEGEGEGEDGNANDALLFEDDKPIWKTTTAPETRAPETTAVVPILPAEPTSALPCGVVAAILPEEMRSLSLLGSLGSLTGMSTEKLNSNSAGVSIEQNSLETLADAMARSDMQLAEVQLGTLCVVELADGFTTRPYVYDMTTGSRLDLCDFLGSNDALSALADASGLALTADTFYRPLVQGIYLPELAASIAWDADPTLTTCVARYAMTDEPLCTVEGASIQR